MDLSAATAILNPADILSLLPLLGNAPAASTSFSVSSQQDFSAVLTELTGPVDNEEASSTPVLAAQGATPPPSMTDSKSLGTVSSAEPAPTSEIAVVDLAPTNHPTNVHDAHFARSDPRAKQPQQPPLLSTATPGGIVVSLLTNATVPFSIAAAFTATTKLCELKAQPSKVADGSASSSQAAIPSSLSQPELERAFADVRKFQYTVQEQTTRQPVASPRQELADAPVEDGPSKADAIPTTPQVVAALPAPQSEPEQAVTDVEKPEWTVQPETSKQRAAGQSEQQASASVEPGPSKAVAVPTGPQVVAALPFPQPEPEQVVAEVKKPECATQAQTSNPKQTAVWQREQPASEPGPAEPVRLAAVTTDAIANVQQQALPLRIIAAQKIVSETKPDEKNRQGPAPSPGDANATTPTTQVSDLIRPVDRLDRPVAAHPIEIPNIPHLPVVRVVSMELGDSDSQVTIRIQERGGDVAMQLNAGSDALQQDLQSSVGSLEHALKQEHVQVSTIEVSRKSPIDKVRRMKEAR
jgi:hypothetical protein